MELTLAAKQQVKDALAKMGEPGRFDEVLTALCSTDPRDVLRVMGRMKMDMIHRIDLERQVAFWEGR